jgi:ribosome-associated toxin RatA of RatAB toxin-antitoxin module
MHALIHPLVTRLWSGLLAGFVLAGAALAQEQPREQVFTAVSDGSLIRVAASVDLRADSGVAWSVLTGYEDYPRFITGLSESRVVDRRSDGVVIEQKGELGLLFFRQSIRTRMLVSESPPMVVVSRGIDGSFKDLAGRYELQPVSGGVRLTYAGSFVPDFFLPPIVGITLVRHFLERNFTELAAEITRRSAGRQ